ncbi:hypothetical protein JHK87_031709 [Glycine soja]|nr:hypothetical protein JHK87_031709 [Glycine soja]
MYEVFSRLRLGETEELRNIGSIPKLLPLLTSALEFGLAAASALIALLKMGSWLSVEEFNIKVDEEPVITTNTTIFLGNIGSYLNEGTRKRVLINAFTVRALRDTFPPARGAGIMALCTTSSYYDITKVATRILPNVVVLTIDPDRHMQQIPVVVSEAHLFQEMLLCLGEGDTRHTDSKHYIGGF